MQLNIMGLRTAAIITGIVAVTASCGDKLAGDPQTSYCEALCGWAADCAAAERGLDEAGRDSTYSDCLTSTHASDSDCATAETDGVDPATAETLKACTDAIDEQAAAGECGAFTGTLDEIKSGVADLPTECAGQGSSADDTFAAAQTATLEGGDDMCDRFTTNFCDRSVECLLGDFALPDEAISAVGEPTDICGDQLSFQTDSCKSDSLYDAESDLTDANTARQTARACMEDLAAVSCDDLFSGVIPPVCSGAFTSTDDAASFAGAILGFACNFKDYIDLPICDV